MALLPSLSYPMRCPSQHGPSRAAFVSRHLSTRQQHGRHVVRKGFQDTRTVFSFLASVVGHVARRFRLEHRLQYLALGARMPSIEGRVSAGSHLSERNTLHELSSASSTGGIALAQADKLSGSSR